MTTMDRYRLFLLGPVMKSKAQEWMQSPLSQDISGVLLVLVAPDFVLLLSRTDDLVGLRFLLDLPITL